MTKAKSKPCICCIHYSGGIPCEKAHRPRLFIDGGLRRVCDDFATTKRVPTTFERWIGSLKAIFGGEV